MVSEYVLTACVLIFLGTAVAWDVKTRRIPNWLNVTALVAALIFHATTQGWNGVLHALAGFAVGFGVLFVLWLIGGGGGGDVKLMGALGAWLGPLSTLFVFLLSTFMAIICLMIVVAYQNMASTNVRSSVAGVGASGSSAEQPTTGLARRTLPYAVPAALAAVAVLILRLLTGGSLV